MASEGILEASEVIVDAVSNLFDWIKDLSPGIDQQWLEDLGRDYSPMWGADSWHPVMAPNGYVDRYKAAAETVGIGLALFLIRTISGKVGVSGIASFAGGQYASFKQRNFRSEIANLLEDANADTDILMSDFSSNIDRTLSRDRAQQDTLGLALRALADNDRYRLLAAASEYENIS